MTIATTLFASLLLALPPAGAAVCDPKGLRGAYGLSLTGSTAIGGQTRPVAVLGRLVFDDAGNLSGYVSASFTGLILGNPVTGKYETHADCSVAWSLQDDSGGFQHFTGTMSDDGGRAGFRQIDPGGAQSGILLRTMDRCSESALAGKFHFMTSGSTVDVDTAVESDYISDSGLLIADGTGGLSFTTGADEPVLTAGTYEVQDDCFGELVLELLEGGNKKATRHFRVILVEKGRALGIQTDPGTIVALQLVGAN
ncbi:MAG: hypothetical protein C5B51_30970 [Terriglobia bacterium]|nr:MAG: hypothetical protein C5B51_30970 [Terriglobia bacterium]